MTAITMKTPNPIPALKIPPTAEQLESSVKKISINEGVNIVFFMIIKFIVWNTNVN